MPNQATHPLAETTKATAAPHTDKNAVLYLRVSTKEQAETGGEAEGYSIPAQRAAAHRKAEVLRAVVVAEFVDAGESARSANRPDLQRLLAFIAENHVDYVIVHKIDRLARSRVDDVEINLTLQRFGVTLVSCTENIDETPSGILLHGIMSSIAEFYSRNLANEVIKGSTQKAKTGGTPSKAPLGYLNVRKIIDGREVRTVETDPLRGPLMRWAFEAYATGEWTIRSLLDELTARGLTSTPGPQKPAKPLALSHLHRLLHHPYYVGIVSYRGVHYQGKHEPLVDLNTWHQVQERLTTQNYAGEKQREHPHYLKGSIYCGTCGSRLIVSHAKNRHGVTYKYFLCIGRQQKRTACTQRALPIEDVEEAVAAYYHTVELPAAERRALEAFLRDELDRLHATSARDQSEQERRIAKLKDEERKLLQAHYEGAVSLELLKSEHSRISTQLAWAEQRFTLLTNDHQRAQTNVGRALDLAGDCAAIYQEADDKIRRGLNQAFFRRLLIDDDGTVSAELAPPFDTLIGSEIRRVIAGASAETLVDKIGRLLNERNPGTEDQSAPDTSHTGGWEVPVVQSGADQASQTHVKGLKMNTLVALAGHLSSPPWEVAKALDAADQLRREQPALLLAPPPASDCTPHHSRQRRLTAQEVAELACAYEAGSTLHDLAWQYKIHRTTVSKLLDGAGVETRARRKIDDPAVVGEVSRRYQVGESTATVGRALGLNATTVARILKEAGVPVRPRRGWGHRAGATTNSIPAQA